MKLKEYRRLKKLLNRYKQTNRICFSSKSFGMTTNDLRYLASKGLVEIVPYVNGDPTCRITLTNKAFSYFSDRREERVRFWIPVTISILALIVAILSLLLDVSELLM